MALTDEDRAALRSASNLRRPAFGATTVNPHTEAPADDVADVTADDVAEAVDPVGDLLD